MTPEVLIEGGSRRMRERLKETLQFLATPLPLAVGSSAYEDLLQQARTDAITRKWATEAAIGVRRDEAESNEQLQRMVGWERAFGLIVLTGIVVFTMPYALPVVLCDPAAAPFNKLWIAWVAWSAFSVGGGFALQYVERDLRFLRATLVAIRDRERLLAESLERVAAAGLPLQ